MSSAARGEPLEGAQLIWRRALALARSEQTRDEFVGSLALLRGAQRGPSTLRHALTLGRAELRATPGDLTARVAVRLLERTISWLGTPVEHDEVGSATAE